MIWCLKITLCDVKVKREKRGSGREKEQGGKSQERRKRERKREKEGEGKSQGRRKREWKREKEGVEERERRRWGIERERERERAWDICFLYLCLTGPACSDAAEPIAALTRHFHTMMVSYTAEAASLSDREKYPYFFRTIPQVNQHRWVTLSLQGSTLSDVWLQDKIWRMRFTTQWREAFRVKSFKAAVIKVITRVVMSVLLAFLQCWSAGSGVILGLNFLGLNFLGFHIWQFLVLVVRDSL